MDTSDVCTKKKTVVMVMNGEIRVYFSVCENGDAAPHWRLSERMK